MRTSAEEIDLQDRLSRDYEDVRYRRPYSRMYHDWTIHKMLSKVHLDCRTKVRILDNGCGIGHLKDFIPEKASYTGLDISQGMVESARKRSLDVVVGDSQALCFQEDCFDAIVARSLLHHLPDPKAAVDEMQRVLKSGGEVVFLDTNLSIISSIPRRVAYRGTRFSSEHRNLKFQELLQVLAERFEINQVEFFGYIAYPLLGFPDLIDFGGWFPFSRTVTSLLIKLDELIAKVPIVRSQGWGVIISASLPDQTDSSGGAQSLLNPDLGA